jgi:8-oxo-dGTP pyrophosphatase MutT (NUDIX family)
MYLSSPLADISRRLNQAAAAPSDTPGDQKPAAVALILRESGSGLELLFIERARHPRDPWSGNIGLPGGRMDSRDADLRQTAERETLEEVGIDLATAACLGRLSDVVGANLPVRVACFVYHLLQPVQPVLSHEVHDAFWFELEALRQPQRQMTAAVRFGGQTLEAPAIQLHPQRPVLWGITYRLVSQFCQVLASGEEQPLPYTLPL